MGANDAPPAYCSGRSGHQRPDAVALRAGDAREPRQHHAPGGRGLVRGGGARGRLRLLHGAGRDLQGASRLRRSSLHRRLHRGCAPRVLAQQPVPGARSGDRPGRAACALLSGRRSQVLRLRPRLHRPERDPRGAAGLLGPPARGSGPRGEAAAARASWRAAALEVHRPHAAQGAAVEDRPHAGEPGMSVYL